DAEALESSWPIGHAVESTPPAQPLLKPTAMDWFTGPSLVIGVLVLLGIGALIAWGVRHLEARRRRDEDAARLSTARTGPLAHEPALAGAGVMPVVTWSMRGRRAPGTAVCHALGLLAHGLARVDDPDRASEPRRLARGHGPRGAARRIA